jgi:hypothetical protein
MSGAGAKLRLVMRERWDYWRSRGIMPTQTSRARLRHKLALRRRARDRREGRNTRGDSAL